MPHSLGYKAEKIFFKLIEGLEYIPGENKKLNQEPGTFVPCSIEVIDQSKYYCVVSFCHYLEQNGDLMRDPEMTFLVLTGEGMRTGEKVIPMSFRNDFAGVDRESVVLINGKVTYNAKEQLDQTRFARTWMQNLSHQQLVK